MTFHPFRGAPSTSNEIGEAVNQRTLSGGFASGSCGAEDVLSRAHSASSVVVC